jgi:hypothetical protein
MSVFVVRAFVKMRSVFSDENVEKLKRWKLKADPPSLCFGATRSRNAEDRKSSEATRCVGSGRLRVPNLTEDREGNEERIRLVGYV